jgi:hypothetical protein
MTEYAPQAIMDMFDTIKAAIPSAIMAGVIGDSAHTYGYHRGRNYCSDGGDYSCQTPPDQKGDGEAACALDLSWSKASDQYTVSRRLLDAKHDSRMAAARSFFGSLDGYSVCGWDFYYGNACTSDDSHLWHIHLSILRQHANDHDALQAIASVITAGAAPAPEPKPEDDMEYTSTDTSTVRALPQGEWVTLYNDDDNSQTFVTGPAHFWAQCDLSITGLQPGRALHVRFFQEDSKSGSASKRVTSYPQVEIVGTTGDTAGRVMQLGSLGKPADGWTRRLKAEAYPDDAGVSYKFCAARTFYYP